MTALSVTPVDGRREREAFIALPYELHRRDPLFTPLLRRDVRTLLDPARNPFFEHAEGQLFLARSGGRVVGRIAALHDRRHNDAHGDRTGFFGFFECEEDQAVTAALFEAAAAWLRPRRLDALRGPVNPSMNDEAGLLVRARERTVLRLALPNRPGWNEHVFRLAAEVVSEGQTELQLSGRYASFHYWFYQ